MSSFTSCPVPNSLRCNSVGGCLRAVAAADAAASPCAPSSRTIHGAGVCVACCTVDCPIGKRACCTTICSRCGHKERLGINASVAACVAGGGGAPAPHTVDQASLQLQAEVQHGEMLVGCLPAGVPSAAYRYGRAGRFASHCQPLHRTMSAAA